MAPLWVYGYSISFLSIYFHFCISLHLFSVTWYGPRISSLTKGGLQTNNSSIVSKRSVERLYSKSDEHQFLRYFVKKPQRRSPLINRGYWLRMRAVEYVVRSFLSEETIDPRTKVVVKKVVVNLGCGLFVPLPCSEYSTINRNTLSVQIAIEY